jgi:DNA end-binding protein Ku
MASTVWKGHIAFGLVSVPVKLTCAARAESVSFCQLRASDLSRVGQSLYAKADDTPVTKDEIVKGYEVGKEKYVVVTPEELAAAAPPSADVADILEFVPAAEVDPVYYEESYWLHADVGGQKAYALLYEGLKKTGRVAIAKISMHSREHILALRAGKHGIAAHTLFYPHEARMTDEFHADTSAITEAESDLAGKLIGALAASYEPAKFRDTYYDNVLALIEAKQAGVAAPAPAKQTLNKAVDIMAALEASLAAAKPVGPSGPSVGPIAVPSLPKAAPKRRRTEVAA